MSKRGKKTVLREHEDTRLDLYVGPAQVQGNLATKTDVENYLRKKASVTAQDHAEFQTYLEQKATRDSNVDQKEQRKRKPKLNRRTLLKVATGTAVVSEAAALSYSWVKGAVPNHGAKHAGDRYTEAQRHHIIRELTDSRSDVGGRGLGRWILLLPTKLGGGTYAVDLNSNRVLGSIWYWNYGDYNPISHHLCAFPSADPYHSFEFINSTQGGKNCLIYGIPHAN